jgi:alpha-glucuronidase
VPYTWKLHDNKTVIQYIYDSHYEGAKEAAHLGEEWATLKGKIDPSIFDNMQRRLTYQAGHAIVWRDAIVQYFLKLSGIPDATGRAGNYPNRLEAEDAKLKGYTIVDVHPWEDASRGKAVTCMQSAAMEKVSSVSGHDFSRAENDPEKNWALAPAGTCTAEWTYRGQPGRYPIAVQYFDLQGGDANFHLSINHKTIVAWTADAKLPTMHLHGDNSTRFTSEATDLMPGDTIRIEGTPDGKDPAALDYIEILSEAHDR